MKKIMSKEEFYEKMNSILEDEQNNYGDYCKTLKIGVIHYEMNKLMCELLKSLGYGKGVEVFEKINKYIYREIKKENEQ